VLTMYQSKIKDLEEKYQALSDKIFHMEKSGTADKDQVYNLNCTKNEVLNELRRLRKLQWDHDHEYVNLDDDR
jgi:hypothetical protein